MRTKLTIIALTCLLIFSCEEGCRDGEEYSGNGFEIYLSEKPYSHSPDLNYNTVNFDTIALQEVPILRYTDLKKYDIKTHKLTLRIPHTSLYIGDAGVRGRMFVVTLDKTPIYCGFKWPVISSIPCNWISIQEPYKELDNLGNNEIIISLTANNPIDPRLDSRILNRLKIDKKLD